jgi:uncharacterized protein YdaU (DUF1376 family)
LNHYPFHIGDYTAHTRRLSVAADLAYRRMLDAYYLNEKPLPRDPIDVAAEIDMHDYLDEVQQVLTRYFKRGARGWMSKRCEEEIAHYKGKAGKAVVAAHTRWNPAAALPKTPRVDASRNTSRIDASRKTSRVDAKRKTPPDANALPTRTRTITKTRTNKKQSITSSRNDDAVPIDFAAFWQAYLRKVGKHAALAWWRNHAPDAALLQTMLQAVRLHHSSAQWQESSGAYIPHPTTWLRQGRWQDEVAQAPPSAQDEVQAWARAEAAKSIAWATQHEHPHAQPAPA